MKPQLRFGDLEIKMGSRGTETPVPDLVGDVILQNGLEFHLGEEDEIFEAYGSRRNSYPYRQLAGYSREWSMGKIKTAVLENDFLRAEFLPDFGGRLWSLWDKTENRNLLYTNDVLRYSNLAVRNAWFSGGVEWNISVIGHTPFTTEPLFTAVLEDPQGNPVLRMYEYERIRQVTYQMDFWLGEEDRFLNARMRIVNFGEKVVPMYWWSNIAVPEYKNGRVIVPSEKAYTVRGRGVYKVEIPMVEGIDVTSYQRIPSSVDYFFEIKESDPKYIASVDQNGYGLLHMSTNRLRSRKLFSWGKKRGSDHWQEFLTENAGRYLEIQAGLAKTQYGCLPMPPHTAWEWLERYGAIQVPEERMQEGFESLKAYVSGTLEKKKDFREMEEILAATKGMAKDRGELKQKGSTFGALKREIRKLEGKGEISKHLEFSDVEAELSGWLDFLKTGKLEEPDCAEAPAAFMEDEAFFDKLKNSMEKNEENWYAHYQLGIFYFQKEAFEAAEKEFLKSLEKKRTPWAYHGLASVGTVCGKQEEAVRAMGEGIRMKQEELPYVKEGLRILLMNGGYTEILRWYESFPEAFRREARIVYYAVQAFYHTGQYQRAYDLLCREGGLAVPDIREGEAGLGQLFRELSQKVFGEEKELPYVFDFDAV